uniref:IgGFc-binding protein N-terminal domain-containing protein n=1 Tax=Amphimedon queenslandica TaxID=400682 RepID=A0A1X7SXR9_AMPQE
MDIILSLLLLSSSLLLLNVAGDSPCSEGFMDYSLLESKAGDIGISHSTPSNIAEEDPSKWIIQDSSNKFDCSNTMTLTEVLIGVDIRTETSTRNKYPSIEIWHKKGKNYEKYNPEKSFTIKLSPDNFTTSGLYRYELSPPLLMKRHDRLVLYQPSNTESVVRFYTVTSNSFEDQIGQFEDTDEDEVQVKSMDEMEATVSWTIFTKVLLQPILDNTNCYSIDESFDAKRLSVTNLELVSDIRVFPSIKFTCHGIITKWIIGATTNTHPLIMIRHSDNTTTNAISIDTDTIPSAMDSNVYNITVTDEVRVQPGDVLMINSTGTDMYYQQHNGPFNYRLGPNSVLARIDSNDYPLISAIIRSTIPLMTSDMFMITSSYSKSTSEVISKSTMIIITTTTTQTAYHTLSSSLSTRIIQTPVTIVPITPTTIPTSNFTPTNIIPSSSTSNKANIPPTSTVHISATNTIPNSSSIPTTSNLPSRITTSTKSITTTHKKEPTVSIVHTNPITSVLLQTTEALGSTTMVHSSLNNSASLPTITIFRTSTNTLTPTVQGNGSKDHTFTILLSVISAVFIILAVSILVILIVSVLVCRRRKQLILELPGDEISDSLSDPVYSLNNVTPKEEEEVRRSNPNYQIQTSQGEQLYYELEAPVTNGIHSDTIVDSSVTSITNPYYDISIEKKKGDPLVHDEPKIKSKGKQEINENEMYSLLEDVPLFVPAA